MSGMPPEVLEILERADLCHVATTTPSGPHVTPMVFAITADRLWVTTARGSVKARAWSRDPRVAGVVRLGREAVAFVGPVTAYDALDPGSWGRSVRDMPMLALASARFTRKNARFFAGYAVDAHHVPLAWSPPGRVFAAIRPERTALVRDDRVARTSGAWGGGVPSHERFRATRTGARPLVGLPDDVLEDLGRRGEGVLAIEGTDGVVALPSAWTVSGAALYAVVEASTLALAGPKTPSVRAALEADRPSWWRARNMLGVMARGRADVFVPPALVSGGGSALAIAREAGVRGDGPAVVRVRPERLVWWRGWSSGTVAAR
ncbi:MAG TPA: pyridoxamine 5'-phosphate oxidase family protein [Actinomycetota bacterium]